MTLPGCPSSRKLPDTHNWIKVPFLLAQPLDLLLRQHRSLRCEVCLPDQTEHSKG